MNHKKYGLLTSITMLIGVVIGSGIFFKSDNILIATGGSVALGVVVFCLAAFGIVFGSLTISELATRTSKAGGIITYAEEFIGTKTAVALGWYQSFIYYPVITAVVATVVGVYSGMLFGWPDLPELHLLTGFFTLVIVFLLNVWTPRLGAKMQHLATLIKLLPLFFVALAGVLFGNTEHLTQTNVSAAVPNITWLAALGPVAFSFDGWITTTSIAHETRNAKRNVPIALTVAPIIILAGYVLYFIGINMLLGPQTIMQSGDAHIQKAATLLVGNAGSKLVLILLVVSVVGTVNGLAIAHIRSPYSLAIRQMMPRSDRLSQLDPKTAMPVHSAMLSLGLCVFWLLAHYFTQKRDMIPNSDLSEIAITLNYLLYLLLYVAVFQLYRRGVISSPIRGVLFPILATVGSVMVMAGGMQNKAFLFYYLLFASVLLVGIKFYSNNKQAP